MASSSEYVPPKVWTWNKSNGGQIRKHQPSDLRADSRQGTTGWRHPLQLYSLGTPNGVKVTVMLEELLALGHGGAEYDAWLIKIGDGEQFGTGFVAVNPNSKIPALLDRSGPSPIRVFESGAILLYLAEKFGAFLPTGGRTRGMPVVAVLANGKRALSRRRVRSLLRLAPPKIEYAIDRFAMEVKRQLDVLDRRLAESEYIAGGTYTIADMAIFPWYGGLAKGWPMEPRVPERSRLQERPALG